MMLVVIMLMSPGACTTLSPAQRPQLTLHEVHPFGARHVAFSPTGDRLATAGHRGEVLVWTVPAGERQASLKGHKDAISGLLWIDETHLVSTDFDGRVIVWDTASRTSAASLQTQAVTAVDWLPATRRLVIGHSDGRLRSLSYPQLEPVAETGLTSRILSVNVQPGSARLAVSTADKQVRTLDADLKPLKFLKAPPGKAFDLRFSPDGRQLAGGGWFRLFLWDLGTGELQVRNTRHNGAIISLDYSPDGQRLVSIGRVTDARVVITDTGSGEIDRLLSTQPLCGWSVSFSPNGQYVASSSEDGSVFLYDVSTPYSPRFYQGPVTSE